ncbi:hypothetical protein ENBRE01_0984 [Enteropsectra breve]|nr:hypothetical protein ENBRE01_0984 [Enteropsectra breve]
MEFEAVAEEQTIVATDDNIQDLIHSKSFKERIVAYRAVHQYPELLKELQNEAILPALEVALDTLNSYEGPIEIADISLIFLHISQTKPSIRTKLETLISKFYSRDPLSLVETFTKMIQDRLSNNKFNKVVEKMVMKLSETVSSREEALTVCCMLDALFAHNDSLVKKAALKLAVTVYRLIFNEISKYIKDVKPIILKDLQAEFDKYPAPKKQVVISELPFNDANWKERVRAMNELRDSKIDPTSSDIVSICNERIKDVNLLVVFAAVECINAGEIRHPDLIRQMLQRFKDKKPNITSLIKETILKLKIDVGLLSDNLNIKNPEIKTGILECLYDAISNDAMVKEKHLTQIIALLTDSSSDVRNKTAKVLELVRERLTPDALQKVNKILGNSCTKEDKKPKTCELSADRSNSSFGSDVRAEKEISYSSSNKNGSSVANSSFTKESCRDIEDFLEKYPFLNEKDWSKKVEFIKEQENELKSEKIHILVKYLSISRESNLNVLKAMLKILIEHKENSSASREICNFLSNKITDTKLKAEIITLFAQLEKSVAIEFLVAAAQANKIGKKFLAILDVLLRLVSAKNTGVESLFKLELKGITEKNAMSDFKKKYLHTVEKTRSHSAAKMPVLSDAEDSVTVEQPVSTVKTTLEDSSVANNNRNQVENIKARANCHAESVFKQNINHKTKNMLDKAVEQEFLLVFESDPYKAVERLKNIDKIEYSTTVIQLYIEFNLPSVFISDLISYFVERRYIMLNDEAVMLVSYLININSCEDLALIDRIYPVTKLYKIYRDLILASAELVVPAAEEILKLVYKYKRIEVKLSEDSLIAKIVENGEFISLAKSLEGHREKTPIRMAFSEYGNRSVLSGNNSINKEIVTDDNPENSFVIENDLPSGDVFEADENSLCKVNNEFFEEDFASLNEDDIISSEHQLQCVAADEVNGTDNNGVTIKFEGNQIDLQNEQNKATIMVNENLNKSFNGLIEQSLENISICTTPIKKKREGSVLQEILCQLINEDVEKSTEGFSKLSELISVNSDRLLASSNSIMNSIFIQLFDKYENEEFRKVILDTLLKLSMSAKFCQSLRNETLKSANCDLLTIVEQNKIAADVLVNFCLNCNLDIIKVYFELLENDNDIVLKLIWRHSKRPAYTNKADAAMILAVLDEFYRAKADFLAAAKNVTIKVCLLHIKECCLVYSDGIKNFGISSTMKKIVDLLLSGKEIDVAAVREMLKLNQ